MNTFTENYELNKKDFSKIGKKAALQYVQEMIEMMKKEENDPFFYGQALAKLETYFAPPMSPKKDPLDWAIQALKPKDPNRKYAKYGVILSEIGLCCTDSKRMHILLNYESEKPVVDCNKNWWTCKEQGEDEDLSWYPDVKRVVGNHDSYEEFKPEIFDIDFIDVGPNRINRKYFNQAIAGMKKGYTVKTKNNFPVFITDGEKLAVIMCVVK